MCQQCQFTGRILRFLMLSFLMSLNCGRQEEPLARFTYQEPSGVSSKQMIAFVRLELAPGRYYANQFSLRLGQQPLPCVAQIVSTYLDRSVHMVKLTWIARNLQARETRQYTLWGENVNFPEKLRLFSDEQQVEINNGIFEIKINQKGFNQLFYHNNDYLFRQISRISDHAEPADSLENPLDGQLNIIESNPLFCTIVRTVEQPFYKYTIRYTIFQGFPLILNAIQLTALTNARLHLIEPLVIEKPEYFARNAIFYGKKQYKVLVKDSDDYYDYLIAIAPKSRLFLHYQRDRLRKMRYNYVEREPSPALQDDFIGLATEIDSNLWMSCITPEDTWKKHSAYHCRLEKGVYHISWHYHGFQEQAHCYRFYQQRHGIYWKNERPQIFSNLIIFHSSPTDFSHLQQMYRSHRYLLRFK